MNSNLIEATNLKIKIKKQKPQMLEILNKSDSIYEETESTFQAGDRSSDKTMFVYPCLIVYLLNVYFQYLCLKIDLIMFQLHSNSGIAVGKTTSSMVPNRNELAGDCSALFLKLIVNYFVCCDWLYLAEPIRAMIMKPVQL